MLVTDRKVQEVKQGVIISKPDCKVNASPSSHPKPFPVSLSLSLPLPSMSASTNQPTPSTKAPVLPQPLAVATLTPCPPVPYSNPTGATQPQAPPHPLQSALSRHSRVNPRSHRKMTQVVNQHQLSNILAWLRSIHGTGTLCT